MPHKKHVAATPRAINQDCYTINKLIVMRSDNTDFPREFPGTAVNYYYYYYY